MGVGAVGGIIVYRKGQRVVEEARERGFVGNVQAVAGATASMVSGVSRAFGEVTVTVQPPSSRGIQVTPVRRVQLTRAGEDARVAPATAMHLQALSPETVFDVRELRAAASR